MSERAILYTLVFTCVLFGGILGSGIRGDIMRKEAVRNNAAHWSTNDDGASVFRWGPKPTLARETEK